MSDPRSYVRAQLALDPGRDAELIIRRRLDFVAGASEGTKGPNATDDAEVRERLRQKLDKLRASFWNWQGERFRSTVEKLSLDRYPELDFAATQLLAVNSLRDRFAELRRVRKFDRGLLTCLLKIAVATPRDAVTLREEVALRLQSHGNTRLQRSANFLRRRFPDIYTLQADWLDSFRHQKRIRAASNDSSGSGCWNPVVIFFLFWLLFRLIKVLVG